VRLSKQTRTLYILHRFGANFLFLLLIIKDQKISQDDVCGTCDQFPLTVDDVSHLRAVNYVSSPSLECICSGKTHDYNFPSGFRDAGGLAITT